MIEDPWEYFPDPGYTSRMEEPECCKCDQSRAPVRTPDLSKPNGFSRWSLFLSIMICGLMFGLILELVSM